MLKKLQEEIGNSEMALEEDLEEDLDENLDTQEEERKINVKHLEDLL